MPTDHREACEPNADDEDLLTYNFCIYDLEYPNEGYFYAGSNFRTALDPNFWKGLSKYLGWPEDSGAVEIFEKNRDSKKARERFETRKIPLWRHHAFDFFDLILISGDAEKFWKELLK